MKNLLLIAMFAAAPAAAQEFSFDAEAMGKILAGTRALKVKHDGRPLPPRVSDYAARDLSFRLRRNGVDRNAVYKLLEILHKDTPIAALRLNDNPRGWPDARRVLEAFESLRNDAMSQKRRIVIDYDALERQNKAHAWNDGKNPKERELFDEIIRLGLPPAGH